MCGNVCAVRYCMDQRFNYAILHDNQLTYFTVKMIICWWQFENIHIYAYIKFIFDVLQSTQKLFAIHQLVAIDVYTFFMRRMLRDLKCGSKVFLMSSGLRPDLYIAHHWASSLSRLLLHWLGPLLGARLQWAVRLNT